MLGKILSFEYESTSDNSMPEEKLYIEILIFLKLGYAQKKTQPSSRSVKLQHIKLYQLGKDPIHTKITVTCWIQDSSFL